MKQQTRGSLMLLLCAMVWGAAFVAQSEGMNYVGPFTMQATRYFLSGLVLLPVIALRDKKGISVRPAGKAAKRQLLCGVLCGALLCTASIIQQYGIIHTTVGKSELFSILPFEVEFFEGKHHYPIHYVGNPTVDEVTAFQAAYSETADEFKRANGLSPKPVIALLAGSRKQEIKDNLPDMIRAAASFPEYQLVLAGAPGIAPEYYKEYVGNADVKIIFNRTYPLLRHAEAALVTSGTATLETALFRVPQAVCYHTPIGKVIAFLKRHILKVRYISLVNLIADREVVKELVADTMTVEQIRAELQRILCDEAYRRQMLDGYEYMASRLGEAGAPVHAAREMVALLKKRFKK